MGVEVLCSANYTYYQLFLVSTIVRIEIFSGKGKYLKL